MKKSDVAVYNHNCLVEIDVYGKNVLVDDSFSLIEDKYELLGSLEGKKVGDEVAVKNVLMNNRLEKHKIARIYEIKEKELSDDIVLKLIEPYSAVLIDKDHLGLVVPSFCIILRGCKGESSKQFEAYKNVMEIPKETNVRFIHAYLNCPIFLSELQKEVDGRRKKGRLVTLSKPIISELDVPLLSRNGRVNIINYYRKLSNNMILVNRLIELQKEYFVTVFDQAYNDNLSDAFEEEIVQKLEEKE